MTDDIIKLLGFKDAGIVAKISKSTGSTLEITISKPPSPQYCPICNYRMLSKGIYVRTANHPILQDGRKVVLKVNQRRWKCSNPICGNFISEHFSFIDKHKHNTNLTDFLIIEDFRDASLSAASIARRRNVSDTYAINTFARYVDMKRLTLSEAISVDEVHLKISKYCNYALVIQDFITGEPIDLVPDRKKVSTEPYFSSIPIKERAKVKYLISDMYRPFQQYIKAYFPNAIQIVDSFHVIQLINRHLLGYIRRRLRYWDDIDRKRHELLEQDARRELEFHHSNEYYVLKKYNWLVLKNLDDINYLTNSWYDTKLKRFMNTYDYEEYLFKIEPALKGLRDLKEMYIRFNKVFLGFPGDARSGLEKLIAFYRHSNYRIFNYYVANTLEEYFDSIVNSFIVVEKYGKDGSYMARLSNGPIESLNRIPKDMKRNARGYRNFEHIRQRFLFSQRKNAPILAVPKSFEDVRIKTNIIRGPYKKRAYRSI